MEKDLVCLSLFDGISGTQQAFKNLGIEFDGVNNIYFASEIDKYAIQVTQNNFPNTYQLGDVKNVSLDKDIHLKVEGEYLPPKKLSDFSFDVLSGGSPCFTEDTKIMIASNDDSIECSLISFKDLMNSDISKVKVLSYDKDNKYYIETPISEVACTGLKDIIELSFSSEYELLNGYKVKCTPNHLFLTERGWIEAKDLTSDDVFISITTACKLVSIENKGQSLVYDITVPVYHNFLLENGVVVHNCQDLSIAKKGRQGLQGERSGLFYEYLRILKEFKPKYFLLENVASMHKTAKDVITQELFGIEPILICSSKLTAQNRKRLYWAGKLQEDGTYKKIEIPQPEDKGIFLKDILESGITYQDKSYPMTASYDGAIFWNTLQRSQRSMVAEPLNESTYLEKSNFKGFKNLNDKSNTLTRSCYKGVGNDGTTVVAEPLSCAFRGRHLNDEGVREDIKGAKTDQKLEVNETGKCNTLTTVSKDSLVLEPNYTVIKKFYEKRVFDVSEEFNFYLKKMKKQKGKTIKEISDFIQEPESKIEHYFRVDSSRSIPSPEVYLKLKEFLDLNNAWDEKILNTETLESTFEQNLRVYNTENKSPTLTSSGNLTVRVGHFNSGGQGDRIYSPDGKSVCLSANGGGRGAQVGLYAFEGDEDSFLKNKNVYRVENKLIFNSEGKQVGKGNLPDGYFLVRKLTPIEAERLQGFPDNFSVSVSTTQRYKALGNSFTVPVIEHILSHFK